VRLRANEVTALVNGDVLFKGPRSEACKDGYVALQVQHARVAFRKIQVEVK
jgi:hypothetical protein